MDSSNRSFIFFVAFQCAFLFGSQAFILKHHPNYTDIISVVRKALPRDSFEFYDFKIGSYNALVDPKFHLNYHENTTALSIFMIPRVFEESFVPYLCETGPCAFNNSWTKFTKYYMTKIQMKLWEELSYYIPDKGILYPPHMLGPRHPTILVETAGHVAGGAYYYQRKDITDDPWPKNKTIYGVNIHPLYGGWFYIGPVIILEDVTCPFQEEMGSKDVLIDEAKKIELLNLFNEEWQNQKWRDIICVTKNYTEEYLEYWMTYGEGRTKWVAKYHDKHCPKE